MSSSMFIETNLQNANTNDKTSTSDLNLVVVYGKNGISFDDRGLENLIEEKKISSISVVRLTSPTPSMQNEEEESERLEEMLRKQELGSDNDSVDSENEDKNSFVGDSEKYGSSNDEDIGEKKCFKESDDELSDDDKSQPRRQMRRRGRHPSAAKQKKAIRRYRRERPEIVGLRLEEFYPPEDANEIIKEALKIAGLSADKRSRGDYDFQLFVIKNDHCYTPFTSPSQMKAKLAADKLEAEKQVANRKGGVMLQTMGKQLFVRKKLQQNVHSKSEAVVKQNVTVSKDKSALVDHKLKKDLKERRIITEELANDNDLCSSIDENEDDLEDEDHSDLGDTDYSAATDNDRDSDLDFDVNNPKGRKRKVKLLKSHKRSQSISKVNSKSKRYYCQDEPIELPNKSNDTSTIATSSSNVIQRHKSFVKIISDPTRIAIRSTPSKVMHMTGPTNVLSPAIAALPPIPKKQNENKSLFSTTSTITPVTLTPKSYVLVKGPIEHKNAGQTSAQTHKEIVINKQVMASPKTKGFTDLNKLIEQTEKQIPVKRIVPPITSKSAHTATITSVVSFSPSSTTATSLKGFMPIETAAKNPLPAQISIQSHQSTSELEAEHDKQLDLINSIVQNEMQKLNEKTDEKLTNINENIPELVKMLESTEKVLVSTNAQRGNDPKTDQKINKFVSADRSNEGINNKRVIDNQSIINMSSSIVNNMVGEIDITSATLLATPDGDGGDTDDLPEDILQQVVELIKDDKTLQEAVEKQVFGTSGCTGEPIANNMTVNENPPPLAPISQNPLRTQENSQSSSKSIIQLAISNVPTSLGSPPSTTLTSVFTTNQTQFSNLTSKPSPSVRKEPIQIVRGNGRVITLPPIEAPTTRAKRRAQAQPNTSTVSVGNISFSSNAILSESSMDCSLHSNSSMTTVNSSVIAANQENKISDSNSRRRGSKESTTAATATTSPKVLKTQKTVAKKGGNKSNTNKGKVETEATESEEDDDDDPNKLWCICRQPHNNRFMICCDVCEDWFHGTCVSVTKAMGLEMEQKGIDWKCPKCIKKQEEKKQPKITEMLIKKTNEVISPQSDPVVATLGTSITVQNSPATKATAATIKINTAPEKECNTQNPEVVSHLKLQSGQIINLKDYVAASSKRATIIQTSTSSTGPVTAGQKKLFVTSGQADLKMATHTGTPFRTITVVKQLQPSHQQNINSIKVLKTVTSSTTNTSLNANLGASATFPVVSSPESTSVPSSTNKSTLCIVCKKGARSNSIYCSDDCIRKHAQNALNSLMNKSQAENATIVSPSNKNINEEKTKRKSKGLFEELLSAPDRKPKVERVNVYERKSGRIISGNSAPTTANLKKWLQDNPTFEVIQPGSTQALDLEKKQKLRTQNSSSPTMSKSATSSPPPLKMFSLTNNSSTNKIDSSAGSSTLQRHHPQMHPKQHKIITDYLKNANTNPTTSRPSTPKQLQKYPQNVGIKPDKISKTPEDSKSTGKEKTSATKRQTSTEGSSKNSGNDGEPIRLVVRRTLKEQLLLRINEEIGPNSSTTTDEREESLKVNICKLTEDEIDEFANSTELEMYNYFNRDTGIKYKAKYRSLVFNIKDRKNRTLFAKICGKFIDPKQLVRMSPEEMASQELAKWREQENKHQLEMIKKSELDLLACAKNYVLKTHKGEEVIEGKSSDYSNVDVTIPVEDVVSAINQSDLPNTDTLVRKESKIPFADDTITFLSNSQSILPETSQPSTDEDKLKLKSSQFKERDREREMEIGKEKEKYMDIDNDKEKGRGKDKQKERTKSRDRDREKHYKSKDRHHDKFRSRKRSRSHSRSRSREKGEKRHRGGHKDEKREREERFRVDKERTKERYEREYLSEGNEKKSSFETKKSTNTQSKQLSKKIYEQQKALINPLETYNLIDQILESSKTVEEAANLISERDREKEIENQRKNAITPQPVQTATSSVSVSCKSIDSTIVGGASTNLNSAESDQEPTSTVSIPTPPHDPYSRFIACSSPHSFSGDSQYKFSSLWTGNINMVDVTAFQLSVQKIVGNSSGLVKLLPKELDVVGRIGPETVWDYISKIKKSPNKEILVIRLIPASESETVAYKTLYAYLDNRNRLGVVKSTSSQIKDFYIYPLAAGKNVPSMLQPSEPVDFYDDPYRPDVLIGIIVRVVASKRNVTNSASTSSSLNKLPSRSNNLDTVTPPGSPNSKKNRQSITVQNVDEIDIDAIIKGPIAAKAQKSKPVAAKPLLKLNENDADEPYSPGGSSDDELLLLPAKMPNSMDNVQAAEDELKRKMEEINRQIAAQEMEIAGLLTGESTSFGSSTPSTSKVLANISIPSNLSQILASIKTTGKDPSVFPPPPPLIGSLRTSSTLAPANPSNTAEEYNPESSVQSTYEAKNTGSNKSSTSLLAKLSEAELLSMVPDDLAITPNKPTKYEEEPPPPGV